MEGCGGGSAGARQHAQSLAHRRRAAPPTRPAPPAVQVRAGLGSLPADFDEAVRRSSLPSSASNLARWEAYAVAHMYDPNTAKL